MAAEHTWLILTYHDVVTSGGSAYSTTSAQLDEQLSAIQSQGLAVVTVQEALSELPQLQSDSPKSGASLATSRRGCVMHLRRRAHDTLKLRTVAQACQQ